MKVFAYLMIFIPLLAQASPYGFVGDRLMLSAEGSFLTTNKNYDDNGALYVLNPPNQLSEMRFDLGGSYDFSPDWGMFLSTTIKQVSAQTALYNNVATGISDATLGLGVSFFDNGRFHLINETRFTFPFTGVPGSSANAFINDGAIALDTRLYFSTRFWLMHAGAFGGFQWRSQGLSSQIPLGLIAHGDWGRHFFSDIKIWGEISLANDQYTSTPSTRTLVIGAYNAGSYLYDSVNPSFFAGKASIGWNISPQFNLAAGIRQTFIGYKVADETRFFVALGFVNGDSKKGRTFTPSRSRERDDGDNFEVDTGGE